jgi:hypothetical protein
MRTDRQIRILLGLVSFSLAWGGDGDEPGTVWELVRGPHLQPTRPSAE